MSHEMTSNWASPYGPILTEFAAKLEHIKFEQPAIAGHVTRMMEWQRLRKAKARK